MTGIEIATIAGTAVTLGDAALVASTLIGTLGAIQQGRAQKAAGRAAERSSQYQATLRDMQARAREQQAGQERAAAQRAYAEEQRRGRIVSSRARNIAAASGGSVFDPTVLDILGKIESEADYRAGAALYEGEERARGLEYGADLERAGAAGDIFEGQATRQYYENRATGSFLSAAGTLAGSYAGLDRRITARGKRGRTILEGDDIGIGRYYDLYAPTELYE